VKEKVQELNPEEEAKSSECLNESSVVIRPDLNEYCSFLEFLVEYEQGKSEMIIQKTKFPKSRVKEIDKNLTEEFSFKGLSPGFQNLKSLPVLHKNCENVSLGEKCVKECKNIVKRIKQSLLTRSSILPEIEKILEVSTSNEELISISSLEGQSFIDSRSYLDESHQLLEEKKKIQELYESLSMDHKKLTGKYSYLITRFNKQDQDLKFQAKKLKQLSTSLFDLRCIFLSFSQEIQVILQSLSSKLFPSNSLSPSRYLILTPSSYDLKSNRLQQENSKLSSELKDLQKKLDSTTAKLYSAQEKLEDLENCKNEESDSLDLDSNMNDLLEMQKLRDQVRLLNFKIYENSNSYSKELDNYKSQISKLRSQNFAQEERIRVVNKKISDLFEEKEKLLEEISRFHCFPDVKTENIIYDRIEESHEKISSVQPSDVLAIFCDEVEDIVNILKNHGLFVRFHDNNVGLLRKAVEFLAGLKDDLMDESKYFEEILETLVKDRRSRGLSEKIDFEIGTDSFLKDKQVEIYKIKIKDKKGQIELLKQQNNFLKRTVKDLQIELAKENPVDGECVRGLFVNIVKEVPPLKVNAEQMLLVFMKNLGLTQGDINRVNLERRVKPSGNFKF
jgi:hypothetical protein